MIERLVDCHCFSTALLRLHYVFFFAFLCCRHFHDGFFPYVGKPESLRHETQTFGPTQVAVETSNSLELVTASLYLFFTLFLYSEAVALPSWCVLIEQVCAISEVYNKLSSCAAFLYSKLIRDTMSRLSSAPLHYLIESALLDPSSSSSDICAPVLPHRHHIRNTSTAAA